MLMKIAPIFSIGHVIVQERLPDETTRCVRGTISVPLKRDGGAFKDRYFVSDRCSRVYAWWAGHQYNTYP
jgi:hypothetical protein